MSKWHKQSGAAYRKLKATREREEGKCAASFHVFLQKKYVVKYENSSDSQRAFKECRILEMTHNKSKLREQIMKGRQI